MKARSEEVSLKITRYQERLRVVSYRVMLVVPKGTGLPQSTAFRFLDPRR